ncbi:MAG: FAD-dependent monooxygenase [Actinobacteria bacterium]|nr:FAD-dependent monooxygenase [Actinomycetota bacterium]
MTEVGYDLREYSFKTPPELSGGATRTFRYRCVIVGAGLAGLALAADLGQRGVEVVVIDRDATSGAEGVLSRGVGYAARTIEIFDRLGVADKIAAKAVTWNEGRIFDDRELLNHYVIQPDQKQKWPAFLNLQQFHVEQYLYERVEELDQVDVRWQSTVVGLDQREDSVELSVETPEGPYSLEADWVVACDGAHSSVAKFLALEPSLTYLNDYWAYADVRVDLGELLQRRFWLNLPELNGGAAIAHQMADGCIRYDWQIAHVDPDEEIAEERVRERVTTLLEGRTDYEIVSIGRVRMKRKVLSPFLHGRVIFVGDAAHELPAFGARGGNSAVQDAENLAWKLTAVLAGDAGYGLLDTYADERLAAALENSRCALQSESFINPQSKGERLFRDAVLRLAREQEFARRLINTGRPSVPIVYADGPLVLADRDDFDAGVQPGAAAYNAPVTTAGRDAHLLDLWKGNFTALYFTETWDPSDPPTDEVRGFDLDHVIVTRDPQLSVTGVEVAVDTTGALFDRYGADAGACYVLRPDMHIAGRVREVSPVGAVAIVDQILARAEQPKKKEEELCR